MTPEEEHELELAHQWLLQQEVEQEPDIDRYDTKGEYILTEIKPNREHEHSSKQQRRTRI